MLQNGPRNEDDLKIKTTKYISPVLLGIDLSHFTVLDAMVIVLSTKLINLAFTRKLLLFFKHSVQKKTKYRPGAGNAFGILFI